MRKSRSEKNPARGEKMRSCVTASRADVRDRMIGVKFPARAARSIDLEISFTFRELRENFFSTLVLITK